MARDRMLQKRESRTAVDTARLAEAIATVETLLEHYEKRLPADKKAAIIALVFEFGPSATTAKKYVRLLAG
jgi:hypothetical protein